MAFDIASAAPAQAKSPSEKNKPAFDLSSATPANPLEMAGGLMPKNIGLNILGRTVEDVGKAVGTVTGLFDTETGQAIKRGATELGGRIGDRESAAYQQSGMVPATVVGLPVTAAVGRAVGLTAPLFGRAAPFVRDLAGSIRTGGFEPGAQVATIPGAAGVAARTASRAVGGGVAGGTTAGLIDPDSMLMGTLFGSALPVGGSMVAPVGRAVGNWLASYISPERVAANALVGQSGGADLAAALRGTRTMPVTPGYEPTMSERFVAGDVYNPTISQMEQSLPGAYPNVNRQIYEQQSNRVQALRDQVDRAENSLRQQAGVMTSVSRDKAEQALANLKSQLQNEEARLASSRTTLESNLAARGQLKPGQQIGERGVELKREMRTQVVEPAYSAAFAKAGNNRAIDANSLAAKAEEIFGMPLSKVPRGTSFTAAEFNKLPRNPDGTLAPLTLEQADGLRKAINLDYAAANSSTGAAAPVQLRNITALHKEIDNAVANSNLSDEAKSAYRSALQIYREQFVPRFKTGLQVDILGNTRKNVPRLIPDNVVDKVISNESGVSQYMAMFKGDPQANASLKAGIEDLYERQLAQSPESAQTWLTRHRKVFDDLEAQGVDVRSGLEQTQRRFVQQQENEAALASLQTQFGAKNSGELVDTMLQSSANLSRGLKAMNDTGRRAFAQEISDRAMTLVETGNYAGAVKFLTEKKALIKQAIDSANPGAADRIYADMLDTANFGKEIEAVKKRLPGEMKPTVVSLQANYTPQQLADLQVVANDLKRAESVSNMAQFGSQSPKPSAGRAATESAETSGISAASAPTFLSTWASAARVIWKQLELGVNKRTAVVLAKWMHENPDLAIEALQKAQARAAKRTSMQSTARKVTGAIATGVAAGKATNALAPSTNNNALAEQ